MHVWSGYVSQGPGVSGEATLCMDVVKCLFFSCFRSCALHPLLQESRLGPWEVRGA
jgi:hypothetical protein